MMRVGGPPFGIVRATGLGLLVALGGCDAESNAGTPVGAGGTATGASGGAGGAPTTSSSTTAGGSSSSSSSSSSTGTPKPNGLSCAEAAQCESGHCPTDDDICCDAPCDGPCEACLVTKTGEPNGHCAPVVLETDPDNECVSPGLCNEAGRCCNERPVPPPATCPAICTGGCTDNVCTVECNEANECEDTTISCPEGFACLVRCTGTYACRDAIVQCPELYPCQVQCDDGLYSRCRRTAVLCSSGTCEVQCADSACNDATIDCGPELCAATCTGWLAAEPEVTCNDSCSCSPCD